MAHNENILEQLRNGTEKFELVSSPVPSVTVPPNPNTSLSGIANFSTLSFARIASSFGRQSPAMKKLERFSVQKVTGDGRCLFRALRVVPSGNCSRVNPSRFGERPFWFRPTTIVKVAEHSSGSGLVEDGTLAQKKFQLYQAVEGINRGIFGLPSAKKFEIESLVKQLESQNPTPNPTQELEKVAGCWRLIYSTISILGVKRTKLGIRDLISLDEFFQSVDVAKSKAVNVIKFSARGLSLLSGQLRIEASFKIASTTRVDIKFENSSITPDQLMNLFQKNYDLLLGIFNPEGWLEITYVDDTMRIGRDDEGNIFVLERFEDNNS